MKILSTFDTNFEKKVVDEELRKYGKERTFTIHKGKFFLWLHVILPAVFLILGFVGFTIILFILGDKFEGFEIVVNVLIIFAMGAFVYVGYGILKQYIDYIMDFAVITPDQIISYNQTGILSRQGRTLDVDKIKTISVSKDGLLRSLFDFGSVVFLSEGDTSGRGDIELYFIDTPDKIKSDILRVIDTVQKKSSTTDGE